jgi:transcriptional regulator with XRE-family HTH domain
MEQEMIRRLKEMLAYLKLSPSNLADAISINRSRLSHILNGRNNPTLEVITGILNKYNEINPDWLLFGIGPIIRPGIERDPKDLFQYAELNKKKKQPAMNEGGEEVTSQADPESALQKEENIPADKPVDKPTIGIKSPIKRITVYFGNNVYQDFNSD